MEPLTIALLVLLAAGIWAVVELALTLKQARTTIVQVAQSANDTIEQLQPIIAKADGMVDDLQPTMKRVDPLVEQVDTTVGLLNESLGKVDGILGDVSAVSEVASNVTTAASSVATGATSAAVNLVSKVTGRKLEEPAAPAPAALEGTNSEDATSASEPIQEKPATSGYVVYGEQTTSEEAPATDDLPISASDLAE